MLSLDRRYFLRAGTASLAVTASGWFDQLARAGATDPKRKRSCILLWMSGGPATIDLWDMKPGRPNGGEHKPKPTAVSDIQISEHLPLVAKQFKNLSIIRSLGSGEGDRCRS